MSPFLLLSTLSFASTRRFAIVAGANDGGSDRPTLRYAGTDAIAMAQILEQMGGVEPNDRLLLAEPTPQAFEEALGRVSQWVASAEQGGVRTELVVYYSGHSDEEGLLLAGRRYAYEDLRRSIDAVGADVRIAILDSCSSGAMVRTKGGTRRAPFLLDQAVDVSGYAFLSSSAEDEAAQESDRIGGSVFTHFLLSGLRGAADHSRDGRVTLGEAYHHAYSETLARTERSTAGAQHAAYDIQLSGTGDLVLTDLSRTDAALELGDAVTGRLYVRTAEGALVAEVSKPAGRAVTLALEAGEYTLVWDHDDRLEEARLVLKSGETAHFDDLAWQGVVREGFAVRGDADREVVHVPFTVGIVPSHLGDDRHVVQHVALSLGVEAADELQGTQVSIVANQVGTTVRGMQATVGANIAGGPVRGFQTAVGANIAGGAVTGVGQSSVGLNVAGGSVEGFQLSVGGNVAAGTVRGTQVAVGFNAAEGTVMGVQGAVGLNVAPAVRGVQLGSGVGVADAIRGVQLNLVNVADDTRGLQLGLVNVGRRVAGAQVGLVNIAEDADESFGLVSINGSGYNHVFVGGSDLGATAAGTFGGKRLFTKVELAGASPEVWMLGLGVGWHQRVTDRFFLDLDGTALQAHRGSWLGDQNELVVRSQVLLGAQVLPWLAVVAGPSLSVAPLELGDPLTVSPVLEGWGAPHWWGGTVGLRI